MGAAQRREKPVHEGGHVSLCAFGAFWQQTTGYLHGKKLIWNFLNVIFYKKYISMSLESN